MTTQTVTLELLTTEYNWKIGESGSLKTIRALDKLTIGNVEDGNFTSVTTSNVTSSLFIGNLDGRVGTLSVSGNMSGSVIVEGDGTNATTMNLELELDNVNSTTGSFGNQTSIPTFSVDKYGRVTNVSESTISTTLSLTDDNNSSGSVDLLTGGLNISGTSNQIETSVSGNTYTLSLPDDLNVNNVSLSGNLDVALDSTLNTLTASGAASMGSTLSVTGDATLNNALTVSGAATMNSSLDVSGASTLNSALTVSGAATMNSSLDVSGASTLNTLTTSGAASMGSTLSVSGDATLNNALTVSGAATMNSSLDVSGASTLNTLTVSGQSTYLDNILATKDVTVQGNIYVRGNLAQVDAETIVLSDPLIVLGNSNMSGTYQDLGFQFIKDSNEDNYGYFGWVGLSGEFQFYETAEVNGNDLVTGNSTLGNIRAERFIGNVVEASSFVGPLSGTAISWENSLTLDFNGNVIGNVTFYGNETSLTVPLELQEVAANVGTFGNSVSVPTISVDTYGRVTGVSENSISTTLSLLDTDGSTGSVDLLAGDLRINGTERQIVSDVTGNTYTLSLPNNLLVQDISMSGVLQVDGAASMGSTLSVTGDATLNSGLTVSGAASMDSTLTVTGNVQLNKNLVVEGNLTVKGTETRVDVETLVIQDNKIELNTDGDIESFGIFATINSNDVSLFYEPTSSRWEFNKDLYVSGNLLISDATTLQNTLLVSGATTMNSTLDVSSNIATPTYIIKDSNSSNTVSLVAPDLSSESSYTLTLPSSDGEDKQFLQTDGAGNLSWVTPDSTQQMKGNVITSGNYLTSTTDDISLNNFSVTYTPTLADSSVFLQYKIPYEASIQADQRISFIIKKSVDNGSETLVQKDSLLGPKNATGGMRNLYISNIYDTNTNLVGNTVTYNIYSKLESEVTATDNNGNTKTAGVVLDGTDNFGSFMLNEFAN